jgi:hypothetical protein
MAVLEKRPGELDDVMGDKFSVPDLRLGHGAGWVVNGAGWIIPTGLVAGKAFQI